jgi:hypothetical protein
VIDAMTMSQAGIVFAGWRESPPAHHMMQVLATQWGWKPRPAAMKGMPSPPPPGRQVAQEILTIRGMATGNIYQGLPRPMNFAQLLAQTTRRRIIGS